MKKLLIPIFLIVGISLGLLMGADPQMFEVQETYAAVSKTDLLNEFQGAYDEEVEETGVLHEINLVAAESEVELIPGEKTMTWSYNGVTPAEEIRIKLGDEIKINFENQLEQATSIHFHGIRVPNEMDGVPTVTQDFIEPGETFVYQFVPKDAGTYWYHPHFESAEQIEMGLYGVIVVEDETSELYSQDEVWLIDDWLLQSDYQIYPNFVTGHDLMHDGRWGNLVTVNSSIEETLIAKPGERIRLRLVNTSNGRIYELNFGELEATAIAVDGLLVGEVFDAEGFELAPGNRIDLDITIPADAGGEEFIVYDKFTRSTIPLATILVEGEAIETPVFDFPTNPNVPGWEATGNEPDLVYELDSQRTSGSGGMHGMMNLEWVINDRAFSDIIPDELESGEFVKIQFKNESSRLHPMHIHGQFFKVISRDGKPVDEPYFRDTVLAHPNEIVEVGMVPLDSGSWMNHCHILEHAEAGMMTIIEVK